MRKIFTIVLTLLVLVAPRVGCAQQELTVHNGTLSNEYVPVYGFYADEYQKMEMVYPALELSDEWFHHHRHELLRRRNRFELGQSHFQGFPH